MGSEEEAPLLGGKTGNKFGNSENVSEEINSPAHIITCRVCQAMIDISEKKDQHVVKCPQCNEATPIKSPPAGKKYVRCPCNCLLICQSTSQRIACPRPNCGRIITLSPSYSTTPTPAIPGLCQVYCAHCNEIFMYNTLTNALSRCPHCRKISSVGSDFSRNKGILFLVLALIMLAIGIGITAGTFRSALIHGGIFVAYVGAFIIAFLLLARSIYYFTMKVSTVRGPP